ncbi:MAG: pyridoxamine 5'-phosphate oxidase family protein [Deltaproteobacteria bacterium]|nr:pyridoxamine 5'-phosphate oxidase family protein [Deltaproteobacteria bacterium]
MKFVDRVKFANENPAAWVATSDGDQPRVRGLALWFADEKGFYFQIGGMKDMCRQLLKNQKVEAAFHKPGEPAGGTVLRVTGVVEFMNDAGLKEKVLADRPFLRQFGLAADHPDLVIFRISKGEAFFWNFETNLEPKKLIIAGAAITNGNTTARLTIESNVSILREKDVLTEKNAASPARKIYYIVQLMYLDQENLTDHHRIYWNFVRAFVKVSPNSMKLIDAISEHVLCTRYYQALKLIRRLIGYEHALMKRTMGADKEISTIQSGYVSYIN